MNRALALLLVLLMPHAARAEEHARAHLAYAVYAAGLNVLDFDADIDFGSETYRVDLSYRTVGVFGTLFRSNIQSFVQGAWAGAGVAPRRFASWGQIRGVNRRTVIDYEGGQPVVRTLEPAVDENRDPVPPAMTRNTIDTLSAMALLVRQVLDTGRCDGHAVTFDGHRVGDIQAHTAGHETLPSEYRTMFSGDTLRCDVDGKQLAGFQHDVDEAELRKVHRSTAWLARVMPGVPPMPVRVVFETRFFGHATAYLTAVGPARPVPQ